MFGLAFQEVQSLRSFGSNLDNTMETLEQLVVRLRRLSAVHLLSVVAAYPVRGETGQLDKQGEVIQCLWEELRRAFSQAAFCRVMWAQLVMLAPEHELDPADEEVRNVVKHCRCAELELRAVTLLLEPRDATMMLHKSLGELSSRRNFGTEKLGRAKRSIESEVWTLEGRR
jgi:hypothetical protein